MKNINIMLILGFLIVGCEISTTSTPINTNIYIPTITSISTATPSTTNSPKNTIEPLKSPTISPTITITPENTLEPEKAREIIKTLLSEPIDCTAPCFWDIRPEQTTVDEADNIFKYFGIEMARGTYSGNDFAGIRYKLDNNLSLLVELMLQNNIVQSLQIKISSDKQKTGIPKEWQAYSPEILIKRYGTPSKVDFVADWGPAPRAFFSMQIYFDSEELIAQYAGVNILTGDQKSSLQFCPLTAQFDGVWLWLGKNPYYPPGTGVPLVDATSLTLEDFSKILTGNPDNACFQINGNLFP